MESVISDGMCRCCATEGNFKDFQVSFLWMGVEEIYGNMLKECFDITLLVSEEVNNGGICEVCITQLRNAYNFKRQVQATEDKFRKMIDERAFKTDEIKMEVTRFDDEDSNNSADDFSSQEYEVPIKEEKVEEKPRKRAARASTSKAKKSKTAVGETSTKRNRQMVQIVIEPKNIKKEIIEDDASEGNEFANKKFKKKANTKQSSPRVKTTVTVKIERDSPDNVETPATEKNKHTNNFEVVLEYSNATPIRSHDGLAYTCCFCTDQYVNPADLKTHTLTKHCNSNVRREFMKKKTSTAYLLKLDITSLKCKLCEENIDTLEGLFDHLQNEHNKLIYMDVKNQIIPFKFDGEELQCAVCSLAFGKYKMLLEHMHTHYRNYVCEICNCGFINRRSFLSHKETHVTGEFECGECDKVFENPQSRRTHVTAVHKLRNLPSKCGVCNERFKTNTMREQHIITMHGKSPVMRKCLSCDRTFTNQNSLRLHTKKDHLRERDYQCPECVKNFFTISQLKRHLLKHTGEKDFQCDVCMKWFTRKSVLTEHMRIHTNDRRFTCLLCGRGFVQKYSWRYHMKYTHGETVA